MGGLRQGVNDKLRGTAVLGTGHSVDVSAAARRDAAIPGLLAARRAWASHDQSIYFRCGDGVERGLFMRNGRGFEVSENTGFRVDAWRCTAIVQTILHEQRGE
jgi:hypothetical protein